MSSDNVGRDTSFTAQEAIGVWDSLKDSPPRNPPGIHNGHGPNPTTSYAWNDDGNGQRLLDAGGRDLLLYVPKRIFPWYRWDGNCCAQDKKQHVAAWMSAVLRAAYNATWQSGSPRSVQTEEAKWLLRSGDTRNINAALAAASLHVSVDPDVFDKHDWYLPCNNGLTYDFETGQVIKSLPEHRMSRCVDVPAIDGPAPHPVWDGVLDLVMGGNAEMVRYICQKLGLCATGYVGEKSFWFWQGNTDAGKTTMLTFLARLLGPFGYSIPLRAILKQRQDTGILHDIAGVNGIRLVYAEEFKPGDVLDSSWVKKISGGGDITADRKGEPDVTFRSTAKLIIGTNDMPAITDIDDALRGRVRVVPFPANIPAAMKERGLPVSSIEQVVDALMAEAPAILYDLMLAVGEWREAGKKLEMPEKVTEASKTYLDEQDPLIEWFEACFEKKRDGTLTDVVMELPFNVWYYSFVTQSGKTSTNSLRQRFGEMLMSKGFEKRAAYDGKRYTGPRLTREAHAEALLAIDRAAASAARTASAAPVAVKDTGTGRKLY